jgi:hypothetical protein
VGCPIALRIQLTRSYTAVNGFNTSSNCGLEFGFTGRLFFKTLSDTETHAFLIGSGVTVHVLLAGSQGVNVSVVVDRGLESIHVLAPIGAPNFIQPQVSLFDVQSLAPGFHIIFLTFNGWNGGNGVVLLDDFAINQTTIPASTSTSMSMTLSARPTASILIFNSHSK